MDTLNCMVGHWRAEARIQEVEAGKLMAVIRVTDGTGSMSGCSRHTAVFDHLEGQDQRLETQAVVQHILQERYGI
jgi:hypothetical protein